MDKKKFKSILALNGDTQGTLAEYLDIGQNTLSAKINSYRGADFSRAEIELMKKRYNLSADQIDSIFFSLDVS